MAPWPPTVGRVLALVSFILALIALIGVAATVPLIPIAVLILALGVVIG